jgi:hypothetical protein
MYPTIAAKVHQLLQGLDDEECREFVMTHMVLRHWNARRDLIPEALLTTAKVLKSLITITTERNVHERLSAEQIRAALGLIAWKFFLDDRGVMGQSDVHHLLASSKEEGIAKPFQENWGVGASGWILANTVFFPVGKNEYRFQHNGYMEALIGAHVGRLLNEFNVEILAEKALYKDIYRVIDEELRTRQLDQTEIERLIETLVSRACSVSESLREYVVGNLVAFIGYSDVFISRATVGKLLHVAVEQTDIARHVILNSLAYKALRTRSRPSELVSCLKEHSEGRVVRPNLLTSAMASSYLIAFGDSVPGATIVWPNLSQLLDDAIKLVCSRSEDGTYSSDAKQISLQRGFLHLQPEAFQDKYLVIGGLHYACALAAAIRYGGAIREVEKEFPLILENQATASFVGNWNMAPQLAPWLLNLFGQCRLAVKGGGP